MDAFERMYNECDMSAESIMEAYLDDLRSVYAMEAGFGSTLAGAAKSAKEGIAKFAKVAGERIVQLFQKLIENISNLAVVASNLASRQVEAPSELVDSFDKMLEKAANISKKGSNSINALGTILQKAQIEAIFSGEGAAMASIKAEYGEKYHEILEAISDLKNADVLKGRSAQDYIANMTENTPRKKFNARSAQMNISKLKTVWTRLKVVVTSNAKQLSQNINMSKKAAGSGAQGDATRQGLENLKAWLGQFYSMNMGIIGGMLQVFNYLARYIAAIRQSAKFSPIKDIEEGAVYGLKALPA